VHRSPIAADAQEFAIQMLRDQLQRPVYPVHRLDRKTAGVLLFTLDKSVLATMSAQFAEQTSKKKYLAVLRGYAPEQGTIDYALHNDSGTLQDAVTDFELLGHSELDFPSGKFPTSRYSLMLAKPRTGRMHQLRKHFAHIYHPIIGDRPHGCNKQNKIFLERFNMNTMLLHAFELEVFHPITQDRITLRASLSDEFVRMANLLDLSSFLPEGAL